MLFIVTPIAVLAALATFAPYSSASPVTDPNPEPVVHHDATDATQPSNTKRCGCGGVGCGACSGYSGYGGYGGWGRRFPFVNSFNNNFDHASSCCNFNDNTVYASNVNACQSCDAVNSNSNASNSFRKRCGCGGVGCGACRAWRGFGGCGRCGGWPGSCGCW